MSAKSDALTVSNIFVSAAKRISKAKRSWDKAFEDTKQVKVVISKDSEGNSYHYAEAVSHVTIDGEKVMIIYPSHEHIDQDKL